MIMVIGGYGQVGGLVSKELKDVIVAGRNVLKATQYMKENKVAGIARYVDTEKLTMEDFNDVDCVVM